MDIMERIENFTARHQSQITKDFFLAGDFRSIGLCAVCYLIMVIVGVPYMQNRKEFHVKPIMQIYNIFMVLCNLYILAELIITNIDSSILCEYADFKITPHSTRYARAIWIYFLTKIIEYADTFFFIVRKKFNQVTFLHVYHHCSMSVVLWMNITFTPVGDTFVSVSFNSLIHVIMYSYYFFAALGPEYTKYLWWKKHLTKLQIIQFLFIIGQNLVALHINCNPDYNVVRYLLMGYMASFVVLFSHFYLVRYIRSTSAASKSSSGTKSKKAN